MQPYLFDQIIAFVGAAIRTNIFIFKLVFRILFFIFGGAFWAYRKMKPKSFNIPFDSRFEHAHIVGGSGHGKTQLLQHLISSDIQALLSGRGSVVIIDSQGDMIRKVLHLGVMRDLGDRLLVIDPTDIEFPPCLNLFDFGLSRVTHYDAYEREKLINGAISLYEYIFGSLLGAELTNRQGANFRYLARLMMIVPNATIFTLIDFLREPQKVEPYINQLEGSAAEFFKAEFALDSFADTRKQIRDRLFGVLSRSMVLERMFSHSQNKVNLFDAMNRGSLILINTAKDLLKQEGTEIFGRFFIALLCQATQERAAISEERRRSTFIYIDEAQDYFRGGSQVLEDMLSQSRKGRVALTLAHQNLAQLDTRLREIIMGNTATKLVGGLTYNDAQSFAKEMRCEPEFLQSMKKHDSQTEFACFVRDHTQQAFILDVPFGTLENQPKISGQDLTVIRDQNRARYCAPLDKEIPKLERQAVGDPLTPAKPELL